MTTGALRRRRSDELDLSDSDYGEEARRRIKRREESKMRRALLAADENMGKIGKQYLQLASNSIFHRTSILSIAGMMAVSIMRGHEKSKKMLEANWGTL